MILLKKKIYLYMKYFKIYFKFIRMNFISGLQYKGWILMVIQTLFVVVTDPIGLIFLFSRFGHIGPWSVERIILVYAMAVTSYGLAETFCRGFDYFPFKMIRSGDFDRVLLRPQPLPVMVAGSYFHIHRIARVFGGICAIIWSLVRQGIQPSPANIAIMVLALVGGFLTYAGVFVLTSGVAFYTIKGLDWIYLLTNASYQVTRCPKPYLPGWLRYTFTFFLPVLVISFYPASSVCGWGEAYWKGFLALPAGILFLIFSTAIWKIGVRHYQSTGS